MKRILKKNERGSALFLILIGVALFAALSYVVGGMLRSGDTSALTGEKAKLHASEIMDYGRAVRQAVQELRINGCADTDISFENPVESGYTNGSNTACQVFHSAGGGFNWVRPSDALNDGSAWLFTADNALADIGTSAADLIMILPELPSKICDEINEMSGITATGTDGAIDFTKFTGSYTATQDIAFADGKAMGCLNHNSSGDHYFFYQVLIAR
ncbi:MAG: hypothetical protein ACPGRX_03685 [Bdellovibrionales bacterium]